MSRIQRFKNANKIFGVSGVHYRVRVQAVWTGTLWYATQAITKRGGEMGDMGAWAHSAPLACPPPPPMPP